VLTTRSGLASGLLTSLALWLLVAGRWGSYVGLQSRSVYLTDVVLIAVAALLLTSVRWSEGIRSLRRAPLLVWLCGALLVVATARLAFSSGSPMMVLRDYAPYGYAGVALLAFLAPPARWERATGIVLGALAVHTLLVANAVWSIVPPESLPMIGRVHLLSIRPDFDSAVCGVTAAAALYVAIHRRPGRETRVALMLLAAISLAAVLTQASRGGLLAAVLTVIAVLAVSTWERARTRPVVLASGLMVMLVVAIGVLAWTTPGQRLADGITGDGGAAGTINARQLAYERVVEYTADRPERIAVGVGFGPDFLTESGALLPLAGTDYEGVRSPHNYLLGTWARLGLAGLLLAAAIMTVGVVAAVRALREPPTALTVVAAGCLIALPLVAMLGVVLESPFGAVVYFWAIGRVSKPRVDRPPDDRWRADEVIRLSGDEVASRSRTT
jgi:O-antigen ligase